MPPAYCCLRHLLSLSVLLLAGPLGLQAQEPAARAFKVTVVAQMTDSKGKKMGVETTFAYTFQQSKGEVAVICDGFGLKAAQDGKHVAEAAFNKERMFAKEKGKVTIDAKLADAPPQLKQMLQDSFGVSL